MASIRHPSRMDAALLQVATSCHKLPQVATSRYKLPQAVMATAFAASCTSYHPATLHAVQRSSSWERFLQATNSRRPWPYLQAVHEISPSSTAMEGLWRGRKTGEALCHVASLLPKLDPCASSKFFVPWR
eukprot:scaffold1913_cov257-Pinguiococcus_pyrenoidosus.AAC.14